MSEGSVLRAGRNLGRLISIARALAHHDALWIVQGPALPAPLRFVFGLLPRGKAPGRPGERLAAALVSLGPSFIKLGQALSTRADVMGEEIAADLSMLQDRLPAFPAAQARETVEHELGRPIAAMFASFEDAPVAAASIAQVHFAVTTEGRQVAVKVLRPEIEAAFARDLDLFFWLAEAIERWQPAWRRLKPREVVRTFADTVRLEMDLRFEAAAAAELAENFAGDADFSVPQVDWSRTARRVLTTERIAGLAIDDRAALVAAGIDPKAVLAKSSAAFFHQVFRDGFFHGDLHPGNLFVRPDGTLAAVDFGITGRLDRRTRYYLADMLLAFLEGDWRRAAEVHFTAGYVPAHQSKDAFTQACRSIGQPILGKPLEEISLARLLGQLFEVTEAFEMETQPQLLLLQKAMLLTEGIGRRLDPGVNVWALARPLIEAWMRENRGPEARLRDALGEMAATAARLPALVDGAQKAAAMMAEGGVRLHPETLRAMGGGKGGGIGGSALIAAAILILALIILLKQ